jgi:hypothetical protein
MAMWALALSSLLGCEIPSFGGDEEAKGTVFLWISSDKDTYVSCGAAGPPCPEENLTFGTHGTLAVAKNGVGVKQIYVHFGLPTLPEGTVLEEAYLELYHPAQNEDGQTDDVDIPVARASAAWSPEQVSWATQPDTSLTGGEATINLRSTDWSGTEDIVTLVDDWYANPGSNHGFRIYWNGTPGIEKGFYSNNDINRKVDDLGLAPRLLIRMELPEGKTTSDMTLPALPTDNDLSFPAGEEILMVRFAGGTDWPNSWKVTRGL